MTLEQLVHWFTYHPPTPDQIAEYSRIRNAGLSMAEVILETTPASADQTADLHDHWMRQKLAEGWVYGPVKDAQAKTHPCLVPYRDLPVEQRAKDQLFVAIVEALRGARP